MTGRRRRAFAAAVLAGLCLWGVDGGGAARAADPSNDYFWEHAPTQWGLLQVGAPAAWRASTGQGALVGIVDSGVDAAHEDLVGKVVAAADCIGANGNPQACRAGGTTDPNGHGTHVAGIIAADTNNGVGIAGMAPDARLVIARAVDAQGQGRDGDVGAAIQWVVDHGATVVNLSLGVESSSAVAFGPGFSAGVRYAWAHGAVPVVAAGNSGQTLNYGSLDVIVVAATTPSGQLASYSNQIGSARRGVVAPGGASDGNPSNDVVSTYPGNQYAVIAGTSMAAAHVSGALALLRAQGLGRDEAVQRLLSTAVACGGCGSGRIDAAAATGAGTAPAPSGGAPPGAGGTPGQATFVGPSAPPSPARAPAARPRVAAPPRAAPAPTVPTPTTATPAALPATDSPPPTAGSGGAEVALGQPFPSEVRAELPRGSPGRGGAAAAAVGTLLISAAGAVTVAWRRRSARESGNPTPGT